MFSGIVAGTYPIKKAEKSDSGLSLEVNLEPKMLLGLEIGASLAINGVCLTVISLSNKADLNQSVAFDVVPETLKRSNLSELKKGSLVNVGRSLKFGDEVGGHLCSGHVDGIATVIKKTELGQAAEIDFQVTSELLKYILEKGYVALNGVSLTVAKKLLAGFRVAFIPETLSKTNLGALEVGSRVNLEIDRATQAIVETVERVVRER